MPVFVKASRRAKAYARRDRTTQASRVIDKIQKASTRLHMQGYRRHTPSGIKRTRSLEKRWNTAWKYLLGKKK